jgi:dethiobiotin synthetase
VTAIFITATGPDVGKTVVVASLIRHLRQIGHSVEAIIPIVTGYDPAQAAASEPGLLISALDLPFSPESIERMSPWRFRAALSPDIAAKLEGRTIDVDAIIDYCAATVRGHRGTLLIDGVGGVMVPLDERRTMLDVMMALRLPLILVTGSDDGTLSHTLTALDSLFRRDINVLTTIVSETPGSPIPLDEVVASIRQFTEPVIGLPRPRQA